MMYFASVARTSSVCLSDSLAPLVLMEMTLAGLGGEGAIVHADYLSRVDTLRAAIGYARAVLRR